MTISYKLLPHSTRGILLTRDTPLLDTDSGFLLSFDLPEPGEYVAVLIGQDGREHTLRIGEDPVPLPSYLVKPQLVQVSVLQVKDSKPVKRWICPAFRLVSLAAMGKLMYQVVEDYPGLPKQVNELEEMYNAMQGQLNALADENETLRTENAKRREELREEVSADIAGLVKYKELNTAELKKIMDALNETNKEIASIKSEFSL